MEIAETKSMNKKGDSLFYAFLLLLALATLAFYMAWILFLDGLAVMSPRYHETLVALAQVLPGQTDHIQTLLNEQGYVSLWQLRKVNDSVFNSLGI